MEKRQLWYFSFGHGQKYFPGYAKYFGTFNSARNAMVRDFSDKWSFQYNQEDGSKMVEKWNLKEVK